MGVGTHVYASLECGVTDEAGEGGKVKSQKARSESFTNVD